MGIGRWIGFGAGIALVVFVIIKKSRKDKSPKKRTAKWIALGVTMAIIVALIPYLVLGGLCLWITSEFKSCQAEQNEKRFNEKASLQLLVESPLPETIPICDTITLRQCFATQYVIHGAHDGTVLLDNNKVTGIPMGEQWDSMVLVDLAGNRIGDYTNEENWDLLDISYTDQYVMPNDAKWGVWMESMWKNNRTLCTLDGTPVPQVEQQTKPIAAYTTDTRCTTSSIRYADMTALMKSYYDSLDGIRIRVLLDAEKNILFPPTVEEHTYTYRSEIGGQSYSGVYYTGNNCQSIRFYDPERKLVFATMNDCTGWYRLDGTLLVSALGIENTTRSSTFSTDPDANSVGFRANGVSILPSGQGYTLTNSGYTLVNDSGTFLLDGAYDTIYHLTDTVYYGNRGSLGWFFVIADNTATPYEVPALAKYQISCYDDIVVAYQGNTCVVFQVQ